MFEKELWYRKAGQYQLHFLQTLSCLAGEGTCYHDQAQAFVSIKATIAIV